MKKQTITQEMRYRLSLIKHAKKVGVTKTAIKYKTNRQYIYRWLNRYDGDIKQVPTSCLACESKLYQYTAIDEYSRVRYLQIYDEKSTYISVKFMKEVIEYFKFKIITVRTDNGLEFTNRLISEDKPTLFETYLKKHNINHDLIKPYTPKHNGKVERSHRKDNERFYRNRRFYSLGDTRSQLKLYLKEYNNFPMAPLEWKSPNEFLRDHFNKSV